MPTWWANAHRLTPHTFTMYVLSSAVDDDVPAVFITWQGYFQNVLAGLDANDCVGAFQHACYYNGICRRCRANRCVITHNQTTKIALRLRWDDQLKLQEAIVWLLYDEMLPLTHFPICWTKTGTPRFLHLLLKQS